MKNWKKFSIILLIATSLFLILSTVYIYFYLHRLNNSYKTLLRNELNNFQKFQEIMSVSNRNYLTILRIIEKEEIEKSSIKTKWEALVEINTRNFEELSDSLGILSKSDTNYKSLLDARLNYLNAVNDFFEFRTDENKEKHYLFTNAINDSFADYQNELNIYSLLYKDKIIEHSNKMSEEVMNRSFGFLMLGFSPIILFSIVLIVYIVFAVGFLIYIFLVPSIPE